MEAEKRICRRCKKYRYNRGDLECGATAKTITHYSTGKQEVVYTACDVVNSGGHCSMYEYQPTIWEWFRAWLNRHQWILWLMLGALIFQLAIKAYIILPLVESQ